MNKPIYFRTMQQRIADISNNMKTLNNEAGAEPQPSVQPRQKNESIEQYLRRIGANQ
jgi:hypothetical protein